MNKQTVAFSSFGEGALKRIVLQKCQITVYCVTLAEQHKVPYSLFFRWPLDASHISKTGLSKKKMDGLL